MEDENRAYIETQAGLYGVDADRLAEELAHYDYWNDWALMNAIARCQEWV